MITIHRHSRLARVPDKMSIEIHAVLPPPGRGREGGGAHLSPAEIARRIVSDRISDRASGTECRHNSRREFRDRNDLQFFGPRIIHLDLEHPSTRERERERERESTLVAGTKRKITRRLLSAFVS